MTIVSNDPSVWPLIDSYRVESYFIAACTTAVVYDWVLTFGQEYELVWKRRWSLMAILYIGLRYLGISYVVLFTLLNYPPVSVTDTGCTYIYNAVSCGTLAANFMLGVIMITRLHAMYQRSRKMLIFLVVIFLSITIVSVSIGVVANINTAGEDLILYGSHRCIYQWKGNIQGPNSALWVLLSGWELLVLCLAFWVAVKHFRELRRINTGWNTRDYFTVLIKTHVFYFTSMLATDCLELGFYSPKINGSFSLEAGIYDGFLAFVSVVQMFVLGPRLVLSIREFHAELVADSDAGTRMTTIAFQEYVDISTGSV